MTHPGKALLLIGSAKRPSSNSEALGSYLIEKLKERGFETETILLHRSLNRDKSGSNIIQAVEGADLIVLASPLYVDSLPYLVIRTMELVTENRRSTERLKTQRFACIINCGFPEALHTQTAIAICRRFTREAGFEWAGGLGLGGGESINAKPLKKLGGMARNIVRSLGIAAEALSQGKMIPQEAVDLMAKPIIPRWLYTIFGAMGWKKRAKLHGAGKRLYERPYEI